MDPPVLLGGVAIAVAYGSAVHAINGRGPNNPWPGKATAFFYSGLLLTLMMLQGPPAAFDDTFFLAHMVQHIGLVMFCAPLLLLGNPVLLLLRVATRSQRKRWLVPVLRGRVTLVATGPVTSWLVLALVIVGTHVTGFYELALEHPALHRFVEHPLFLGAALLYFYPILPGNAAVRRLSPAARMASLFAMMVPEAMTGFFIYASRYVRYPHYEQVVRPYGPGPLADQQMGGALMWGASMLIDTAWIALAAHEWLRSETRRSHGVDLAVAKELQAHRHV